MNKTQRLLAALGLSLLAGMAQAQSRPPAEVPDPRLSERLACLVRAEALAFPVGVSLKPGLLRAKLRFAAGDQAPTLELLHAQQVDAVHLAAAQDYLRSYRLPCMKAGEAAVEAVQEIEFNGGQPALPLVHEAGSGPAKSCVALPPNRDALSRHIARLPSRSINHVIVRARFDAGPEAPPAVDLVHLRGGREMERAVRAYLKDYRMPCRVEGDRPYHFEQSFRILIDRSHSYHWPKEPISLQRFLGMAKNREQLSARFDFDTMGCPFALRIATRRPTLPNRVIDIGPRNSNRTALRVWLSTIEPHFVDAVQAEELFDGEVTVQVPCGRLELQPQQLAAASP